MADVRRLTLADGTPVVAKLAAGPAAADLRLEAWMLGELRRLSPLPVPAVLAAEPDLLLLEHVGHDGPAGLADPAAQRHAAELVAALHAVRGPAFGLDRDTPIGPVPQPNAWTDGWLAFFRDRRLLPMTAGALASGRVPARTVARLERLAGRLERWVEEPAHPSLLHGDLWAGNVLARQGRIVAFLDPAIAYGHPEAELAFGTLFASFGEPFLARYRELAPLDAAAFLEVRRDLYNLYPLLVHVRLFGATYLPPIERTLDRLGL